MKHPFRHNRLVEIVGIVIISAIISIRPAQARLCACCVEPGARYEYPGEIYDFEFEMINNLKVYRVARLYVAAGFPDGFKGISIPAEDSLTEDYRVSVSQKGRRWSLVFKRKDGERGSLIFTLPKKAVHFGVDLSANVRRETRDPGSIYKELRFKGPVWGTGMFQGGNARATKFLMVFQGYGNACTSESDFGNWTLAITGPRASYRFYGAFVIPTHR
ncbi:MAG TPA: hypothetical protein VLM38_11000 [Blastocatellia bacterium]|nr:hypothetical protein [Blastocatellia bacterium]